MSTQQAVFHTNEMLFKLKESHRKKIEEMQEIIDTLTNQIDLIQKSKTRFDDL
jgi:hypothetical protein